MSIAAVLRSQLKRLMVGGAEIALERKVPVLSERLLGIDEFGLYLHIPFCRQICPYCPYNKQLYDAEVAQRYTRAVMGWSWSRWTGLSTFPSVRRSDGMGAGRQMRSASYGQGTADDAAQLGGKW